MEHAQRGVKSSHKFTNKSGLNPYFNGTCSKRRIRLVFSALSEVLILILMEHAQRVQSWCAEHTSNAVLILILMEHAQRVSMKTLFYLRITVLILILMEHAQRGHFL